MTSLIRWIARRVVSKVKSVRSHLIRILMKGGKGPKVLTATQEGFIKWNSERLNIPYDESKRRYLDSWGTFYEGHGGAIFKMHGAMSDRLHNVFANNNENEIFEVYRFHSPRHFLRMLSYPDPPWDDDNPIVKEIGDLSEVTILDFGCGLAHKSRALAQFLGKKGSHVKLVLADVPTIRKEFLIWLCNDVGIEMEFLECTKDNLVPELSRCNVCFATEFFEHVSDPVYYFDKFNEALANHGMLVTNVSNHQEDFLHISPNLEEVHNKIRELEYEEVLPYQLFRKTSD